VRAPTSNARNKPKYDSLLTLSRVIVALGTPNQTHINFRDSKLTRILQPCLSGNARMAVICCATPSELYLEETRSTMMFASRAKLVKTRAQVNEVLDDRSLIRRLQRELAEARRRGPGSAQNKQLKVLEQRADAAGNAAKEAEEKLYRLKKSILNSGVLFARKTTGTLAKTLPANAQLLCIPSKKKRRFSEGELELGRSETAETTPIRSTASNITIPHTTHKTNNLEGTKAISMSSELELLRHALAAKNCLIKSLNEGLAESRALLESKDSEIAAANNSIREHERVREDGERELAQAKQLQEEALCNLDQNMKRTLEEESKLLATRAELEQTQSLCKILEASMTEMEREKLLKQELYDREKAELTTEVEVIRNDYQAMVTQNSELRVQLQGLQKSYEEVTLQHAQSEAERRRLLELSSESQQEQEVLLSELKK